MILSAHRLPISACCSYFVPSKEQIFIVLCIDHQRQHSPGLNCTDVARSLWNCPPLAHEGKLVNSEPYCWGTASGTCLLKDRWNSLWCWDKSHLTRFLFVSFLRYLASKLRGESRDPFGSYLHCLIFRNQVLIFFRLSTGVFNTGVYISETLRIDFFSKRILFEKQTNTNNEGRVTSKRWEISKAQVLGHLSN